MNISGSGWNIQAARPPSYAFAACATHAGAAPELWRKCCFALAIPAIVNGITALAGAFAYAHGRLGRKRKHCGHTETTADAP